MARNQDSEFKVTPSSGNGFADLGFAEPEKELAKVQLASLIRHVLKHGRLTQTAAANLMGIDHPTIPQGQRT